MISPEAAREKIAGVLQILDTDALVAAVRGDVDVAMLVRATLADRGLDQSGAWVGFDRALEIAKLHAVRRADGSVVLVSVPESEGK